MKESGMSFNGVMVKAILNGRKMMTRRPMKEQPFGDASYERAMAPGIGSMTGEFAFKNEYGGFSIFKCPYGRPGDRLWVRETWGMSPSPGQPVVRYRAKENTLDEGQRWTQSTRMPRWASRITLEVTAVRVERLEEIDPGDVIREGITIEEIKEGLLNGKGPVDLFRDIWDGLYSKKHPWKDNPWVWVVEFKVVPDG